MLGASACGSSGTCRERRNAPLSRQALTAAQTPVGLDGRLPATALVDIRFGKHLTEVIPRAALPGKGEGFALRGGWRMLACPLRPIRRTPWGDLTPAF